MTELQVESALRHLKRRTRSITEQIAIAHWLWNKDIGPNHDGLKASEVEEEIPRDLDFGVRTSLGHLEDAGLVEEFIPPGPEVLVIAEWMDDGDGEVVNGEVDEAAEEGIDALIEDLEPRPAKGSGETAATDGSGNPPTLRSILAHEFDLLADKVEDFLSQTDNPVDVLNRAVDAISEEEDLEVGEDYGKIAFINMPYQYRLTEEAVTLYER